MPNCYQPDYLCLERILHSPEVDESTLKQLGQWNCVVGGADENLGADIGVLGCDVYWPLPLKKLKRSVLS